MKQTIPAPPWVMILLGGVMFYGAYEHYCKMADFEAGLIDRVWMWTYMLLLYNLAGFWPTVILPFVLAGALTITGIALQIRDLRARATGKVPDMVYVPVRWKGLLLALLVVLAVMAGIFGLAFLIPVD